ncbi:hypothetical protein ACTJIL_13350 [Luteimonas sp. 22616]|uniref:hypothetical protein n=1 Tax=Luteimonas sp. 22616 TaxID=3453951 RepID=UPI003F82D216
MSTQSPADMRPAQLDTLLHDLQKRAFDVYEDAALRAEANPAQADAAYAQAEAEAAPLIAQAKALNEERVRRMRRRARMWRRAAIAVAIAGIATLVFWSLTRGASIP